MEKGVSKYWTPEAEEYFKRLLAICHTFAERHMIMTLRDIFKCDGRSRQAKRAMAQARLRIATTSDDELEDLNKLGKEMLGEEMYRKLTEMGGDIKEKRSKIREQGIKRSELGCQ